MWLHVPAVKTGRSKKFSSQWRGPYTVLDKISATNYRIKLVGSPAKDMVVHQNRLKLCYGTPQHSTLTQAPLTSTRHSHADVVRRTDPEPTGGHTRESEPIGGYTSQYKQVTGSGMTVISHQPSQHQNTLSKLRCLISGILFLG